MHANGTYMGCLRISTHTFREIHLSLSSSRPLVTLSASVRRSARSRAIFPEELACFEADVVGALDAQEALYDCAEVGLAFLEHQVLR